MDNIDLDEAKQLINFYRQRSADLEFQVLQLQMKLNKAISEQTIIAESKNINKKNK